MSIYTLTITKDQAQVLTKATEILARLGIGQFRDALECLPTHEFMPDGWHEDMDSVGRTLSRHMIGGIDGYRSSLGIRNKDVSEASRRDARVPVSQLVENMNAEIDELNREKKKLETALSDIAYWKAQETSKVLRRRLPKTQSIEATTTIEAQVGAKKRPLVENLKAIEERLHSLKSRRKNKPAVRVHTPYVPGSSETVDTLLRIEALLSEILKVLRTDTAT